jgi:hypothetical protein
MWDDDHTPCLSPSAPSSSFDKSWQPPAPAEPARIPDAEYDSTEEVAAAAVAVEVVAADSLTVVAAEEGVGDTACEP